MKRLLVGFVLTALIALPAGALSCETDLESTPETLLANRLVSGLRTYDLAVVGRVTGSTPGESTMEFTVVSHLDVMPKAVFGVEGFDGPLTVTYTQFLSGGSARVFPPDAVYFMALIYNTDIGHYVASECSLVSPLDDAESTIATLVGIAQDAGVDHLLVPETDGPSNTSPALTTTTALTTVVAPGGPVDSGEVELPGRGRWVILVAGGLVLAGVASWVWLLTRSEQLGRK